MNWIAYICLVLGISEFISWVLGQDGHIAELLMNFHHPLLSPPFIALYLLLPAAFSEEIRTQIREEILSRFSPILNLKVNKRHSTFGKYLKYSILGCAFTLLVRSIIGIIVMLIRDECGFDCYSNFALADGGYLFVLVIILMFLIQYLLLNTPELREVKIDLPTENKGLYALKQNQFVLEETIGVSRIFNLIQSSSLYYKEKNTIWLTFIKNHCDFAGKCEFEVGSFKIISHYQAVVTDAPNQIYLNQVPLAGIESREQLTNSIERDSILKFRERIEYFPDYQELIRQLQKFIQNSDRVSNNLDELASQKAEAAEIRFKINELCNKLLNQAVTNFSLYGGLYQIAFQPQQVKLVQEKANYLDDFEKSFDSREKELRLRIEREEKLKLKQLETIGNILRDSQVPISRLQWEQIIKEMISIMSFTSTSSLGMENIKNLLEDKNNS